MTQASEHFKSRLASKQTMNLFDNIKEQTKKDHQSVEKVLIGELKDLSSVTEYAALLKRLFVFFKPIEERVHQLIETSMLPDIGERQHSSRLMQDIHATRTNFNVSSEKLHLSIDSISYALGVLYVMEGSTLGGQIIVKMLDDRLSVSKIGANAYFNSYGTHTHQKWSDFKEAILKFEDAIEEDVMIAGAKDTFNALQKHLLRTKSLENTI